MEYTNIGYLNVKIYTDVESWEVAVDATNNYFARKVKKDLDLRNVKFYPGGFAGHFEDLEHHYRKETKIVPIGEWFSVARNKNGVFYTRNRVVRNMAVCQNEQFAIETKNNFLKAYPDCEIVMDDLTVVAYELTPTGRPKYKRQNFGNLETKCRYFYDHNF